MSCIKDTGVNLQIAELEQHIYGMMDIGRGITKKGPNVPYNIIYLIHAVCYHLYMWGSLRLIPINTLLVLLYYTLLNNSWLILQ